MVAVHPPLAQSSSLVTTRSNYFTIGMHLSSYGLSYPTIMDNAFTAPPIYVSTTIRIVVIEKISLI